MVVIFAPFKRADRHEHERIGLPSICTVQAPHCAMPQPNFVPVRPTTSRSTQSSGVSGSISICFGRSVDFNRDHRDYPQSG